MIKFIDEEIDAEDGGLENNELIFRKITLSGENWHQEQGRTDIRWPSIDKLPKPSHCVQVSNTKKISC